MRTPLLCLLLLAFAARPCFARPVDGKPVEPFTQVNLDGSTPLAAHGGVLGAASSDTVFFGGTFWAPDSARWEALEDSCWTFDSGVGSHFDHAAPYVNPFKETSLHAYMEGWVGFDVGYDTDNPYFRWLDSGDPEWTGPACVGAAAGLGGAKSWWAGVRPAEAAALCYAAGQGYGNGWNLVLAKTFPYGGSGNVSFSYDYRVDSEPGFDYMYVEVDTSGAGDLVSVNAYTGLVGGSASITLTEGVDMRSDAGDYVLRFRAYSDGAYSDEDGGDPSTCGHTAIDNVVVAGVNQGNGFEDNDGGWALAPADPGSGGDWSDIVSLNDLPPPITSCTCPLSDSVLVFEDLTVGGHGPFQDNLAASPWIDLRAAGLDGAPGKFLQTDLYAELPLLNYVFTQIQVQWYPQTCPVTGTLRTSPFTSNGFVYYFGGVASCSAPGTGGTRFEFSDIVDPGAEQMRIAVGVISYCRFFANCTNVSNSTPWFDNVKLGVFGEPDAPFLAAGEVDLPQDSFPQNGTLRLDAPGRVDCNTVKGDSQPEIGTALGDTLVVRGGLPGSGMNAGAEVYVEFAVDLGPGAPGAATAWLNQLASSGHGAGNYNGQDWYAARMDTAEQAGSVTSGVWMSAYHEDDPNFTGTDTAPDPNDAFYNGSTGRLRNDIFPEGNAAGLFTMGTRINLFYKTRYVDAFGAPTTGVWYTYPDTTGANYLEMEVLPSSAAHDSTWNCVLYVDHCDGRGAQPVIEGALADILTGTSDNFEHTPWDRWDVRAPSSQQGSFGRPGSAQYGASLVQIFGYKTVVWNSGNLSAFNLVEEDADVLTPWLILTDSGLGDNRLYLSGDGIARSMTLEAAAEPGALSLLEDWMGATWLCDSVRDPSCPGTPGFEDDAACMPVDPAAGAQFVGNDDDAVIQGNGCPERRSFDVLGVTDGVGNEVYQSATKGTVEFASVSMEMTGGPDYRAVIDGGSVHYRRDEAGCSDVSKVEDRLHRVLTWFGYTGSDVGGCSDPTSGCSFPVERDLATVPSIMTMTPEGTYEYAVQVVGCHGPVEGSNVEILFSDAADSLINWAPGQAHPSILGVTDAQGWARFHIAGGGCVTSDALGGLVYRVFADGIPIGEASPQKPGAVTSPDAVNVLGLLPTDPGYVPDPCPVVDSADSAFHYANITSGSYWRCSDLNSNAVMDPGDMVIVLNAMGENACGITAVPPEPPLRNALLQNAPNPFLNATSIAFDLTEPAHVRLSVFDVSGRLVTVLADGAYPEGHNHATWNGRNASGVAARPGIYFYRIESPVLNETRKMVLR